MYYLLVDTETVNRSKTFTIYNNMVFDVGIVVLNENLVPIMEYNSLIKEIYENEELMSNYVFEKEKLDWYKEKGIPIKPFEEVRDNIDNIIKKFCINNIMAYNVNFDINSIKSTWNNFNYDSFIKEDWDIIDIYHMACQALKGNDNYTIACLENGKVSEKGNINSNAEAVYSFITNNYSFKESHIALEDCLIEREILEWVLKEEKEKDLKFKRNPNPAAWRLVQKKRG